MADVGWSEIAAHRERLLRIARRRCDSREDAEDVVQEALLRCATFEGLDRDRVGAFLTTVTIRLCADLYRDAERSRRAVRKLDAGDVPDPEDGVVRAAEAEQLGSLLRRLPEKQRAVLVDRASGLSVPEIGARHALTYKATESALSRARAAMRMALASASALVAGMAATFRRRPTAVAALPVVATLAIAGAVLRMPFGMHHDRTDGGAAVSTPAVPMPRTETVDVERRVVAVRRPAPVAVRPAPAAPAAPSHVHEYVDVKNDTLGTRTRVTDTQETPDQLVVRCLQAKAVWVYVEMSDPDTGVNSGCGEHPEGQ